MRTGTVRVGASDAAVGDGEATGEGETHGVGAADGAVDPGPTDGVADAITALAVEGEWLGPLDIAAGLGVTIGPLATVTPPRQPATNRTVAAAVKAAAARCLTRFLAGRWPSAILWRRRCRP